MKKTFAHIEGGYAGSLGKAAAVKLLNVSVAYVRQVRADLGPAAWIVVRWTERDQPLNDPQTRGRAWVSKRLGEMLAMTDNGRDQRMCFEGYNEIPDILAAAFVIFETARIQGMNPYGLLAGVGSWSVGVPGFEIWSIYQPLLDLAGKRHPICIHEYWADRADLIDLGHWHAGRFSLVPQLEDHPVIITEAGRDYIQDIKRGKPGWQRTCNREEMLADMRIYDTFLCGYPNVIGANYYTMGDMDDEWRAFDMASLWPCVVAETESVGAIIAPTAPAAPMMLPIPGARVSQRFGENPAYYAKYGLLGHNGVDLAVPSGQSVYAWHASSVHSVSDGWAAPAYSDDYGVYVYVWGASCDWLYAHLCKALVKGAGQTVKAGDIIGEVGYTGNCEPKGIGGTHLHWGKRTKPYHLQDGWRGYSDPAKSDG